MNIDDMITIYRNDGYSLLDARSTVCQDIILSKISKTDFKKHITIKGGVVMHNISNSVRRATQDLDMDFIKYSLSEQSIKNFIKKLNCLDDGIEIVIEGNIEELHHQDYDGKRVYIKLKDKYNNSIDNKLDIGVHKQFEIEQDEYCFNLNSIEGSTNLLINSKEQIFAEKLKSLLKFGLRTTRYKDLFDFYYLINNTKLDKIKLLKIMDILIFSDNSLHENNVSDVESRLDYIFKSAIFRNNLNNPKYNWLEVSIDAAINNVLDFVKVLKNVQVSV